MFGTRLADTTVFPSDFVIRNAILMSPCSTQKMSRDGGSKCRSTVVVECHIPRQDIVGSSPITRFNPQESYASVEERLPRQFRLRICKVAVMSSPNSHM